MKIYYPIPVQCLTHAQVLCEHFDIVQTQMDIIDNKVTPLSQRWAPFQPALYDRFMKGREYLVKINSTADLQYWPANLESLVILLQGRSTTLVFPQIPDIEVLNMWGEVFVNY